MTHPPSPYTGWYYTRRELVDTRTWTGTPTPELTEWLGDTPHHTDGDDLLIAVGDQQPARARPGWTLVRYDNGAIIVHSPAAATRKLEPTHPEQPDDLTGAWTTPNNPTTSSDTANNPLQQLHEMYGQQSAANAAYRLQIDELIRRNSEYASRGISNGQRADRLAATLRQVLDAFETYWSRSHYHGPGPSAVQPEHFRAWRTTLNPPKEPTP